MAKHKGKDSTSPKRVATVEKQAKPKAAKVAPPKKATATAPAKSKAAAWSTPKECTKFFKLLEELKVKIDTVSREAADNYSHVDLKRIKVSGGGSGRGAREK
eukprot:CAMPEP_0182557968 /NCGR_PEP_ID=MMETSP1324-20130603/1709_1 /TAXON_ID=236786 /ORGANISM="Florenciella sp., Strain RCC1587" /LENGTH=101 /DNA_ID=CAMNT_0024770113 /DNA_START=32 /DNA_END=335 /DNA_ORIENTATION=-